ncbi:hypothetical protein PR001_g30032 [Phytophthora rubi]|uniref:RxLR effector protein n=1 Tax=Phytophthora rubi TaxID=129364 RepID=A0A6A3GX69_9STRA|nr:hypothetical protein PR001_g30032 [Phytophthora rubi]
MKILASLMVLVATLGPWVNAKEGNELTYLEEHKDSE